MSAWLSAQFGHKSLIPCPCRAIEALYSPSHHYLLGRYVSLIFPLPIEIKPLFIFASQKQAGLDSGGACCSFLSKFDRKAA